MGRFAPTDQQEAIVSQSVKRETSKVKARAGTGKTSTAELVANANAPLPTLYVVFNKAAQKEADARMPQHVDSRTAHSLAFMDVMARGPWKGREIEGPFALVTAIEDDKIIADVRQFTEGDSRSAAFAVVNTLGNWSNSATPQPTAKNVPKGVTRRLKGKGARNRAGRIVANTATKVWNAICEPGSRLPITFDFFLKYWQLQNPTLDCKLLLLDESQDLSPVMLDVVKKQDAPIIAFGDDQQQIYSWRGAVNAMQSLTGPTLPLTKSWRFGPEIAAMANEILTLVGEKWMLEGGGPAGTIIDDLFADDHRIDAVLCRGNAGVIRETLDLIDAGQRVGVVGGTGEAVSLLWACWDLFQGKPVKHPEIGIFRNWEEFVEFADSEEGTSYRPVYKLVDRTRSGIPVLCKKLKDRKYGGGTVSEWQADIVVSTAHKAKGREWDNVRLCDDFQPLAEEVQPERYVLNEEEANLQYVTVTRAKKFLNLGGLGEQLREDQRRLREQPGEIMEQIEEDDHDDDDEEEVA